MESVILLNSNENTRQVEEEESARFVRSIIDSMGLDVEGIWDNDENLSVENKIKLRRILSAYQIQIITYPDGVLQIYHEDTVIGEWKKPQYVLKKDHSQKDPFKKLYLEMKVTYWSIFESTE